MKGNINMPNLTVNFNKILKLTNVINTDLLLDMSDNAAIVIEKMENYIKTKGFQPIGPHIQYNRLSENSNKEMEIVIKLMRQCTGFIHHIEKPYKMESILRVPNCLYIRYSGPMEKIKFAYDKLTLTAFEEDIPLKGDCYSIFLEETDGQVTVDIFMERAD